jgi:hypothetical protein
VRPLGFSHQVDLLTGINGGNGGSAFGLPMICARRTKPVSGNVGMIDHSHEQAQPARFC